MVKSENKLNIKLSSNIFNTLEIYCKESKDDIGYLYKMMGMLTGEDTISFPKEDGTVLTTPSNKETYLNSLMSACFFAGIFIAKKHPKLITEFKKGPIKTEKKEKIILPNYLG